MNKKAQAGPLAAIVLYLMFLLMWFLWLGSFINTVGQGMVESNNMVGVEELKGYFFKNRFIKCNDLIKKFLKAIK